MENNSFYEANQDSTIVDTEQELHVMPESRGKFIVWPEHKIAVDAATICSVKQGIFVGTHDGYTIPYILTIRAYDGTETEIFLSSKAECNEAFDKLLDLLVLGE